MDVESQSRSTCNSLEGLVTSMSTTAMTWRPVVQLVPHDIATHPEHATLTYSRSKPTSITKRHSLAQHAALKAMWQCSGGGVTSRAMVIRPPSDDSTDVEHGERAGKGVQAPRRAGHTDTAGSRLVSGHAATLDGRRWRGAAMGDRGVEGGVARLV